MPQVVPIFGPYGAYGGGARVPLAPTQPGAYVGPGVFVRSSAGPIGYDLPTARERFGYAPGWPPRSIGGGPVRPPDVPFNPLLASAPMRYYTYPRQVPLGPGQMLGFLAGRGYYARPAGPGYVARPGGFY